MDRYYDTDEVLTDTEDDSDEEGEEASLGELAVLGSIGATGLPKEFNGDTAAKAEAGNNNKGEVEGAALADRWAQRFNAAYPGLQDVIKLSQEQRDYLESLTFSTSESPDGDGRSCRGVPEVRTPCSRIVFEGSPVRN